MNTNRCTGTNRDGGPCSATPQTGKSRCMWHDPDLTEQRKQWNRNAGKAKSNRNRARKRMAEAVMSINDLDALLCSALQQVADGKMEPGIGTAMATIAKTVVGIRTASDFERQLAELKQVIGTDTSRRFVA